jgi:hypothetical protein
MCSSGRASRECKAAGLLLPWQLTAEESGQKPAGGAERRRNLNSYGRGMARLLGDQSEHFAPVSHCFLCSSRLVRLSVFCPPLRLPLPLCRWPSWDEATRLQTTNREARTCGLVARAFQQIPSLSLPPPPPHGRRRGLLCSLALGPPI